MLWYRTACDEVSYCSWWSRFCLSRTSHESDAGSTKGRREGAWNQATVRDGKMMILFFRNPVSAARRLVQESLHANAGERSHIDTEERAVVDLVDSLARTIWCWTWIRQGHSVLVK